MISVATVEVVFFAIFSCDLRDNVFLIIFGSIQVRNLQFVLRDAEFQGAFS